MAKKKKREIHHICGSIVDVYRKGKGHRAFVCRRCGLIATNPGALDTINSWLGQKKSLDTPQARKIIADNLQMEDPFRYPAATIAGATTGFKVAGPAGALLGAIEAPTAESVLFDIRKLEGINAEGDSYSSALPTGTRTAKRSTGVANVVSDSCHPKFDYMRYALGNRN